MNYIEGVQPKRRLPSVAEELKIKDARIAHLQEVVAKQAMRISILETAQFRHPAALVAAPCQAEALQAALSAPSELPDGYARTNGRK